MLLQLSQLRFQRRLTAAITLPIVLLLLLAGVSIAQIVRLINALNWIDHTDQVISRANYTQKLLLDVETGFRGYLLTGNPDFLEPYEAASAVTGDSFEELQRLVSDNERQQQRIEQLEAQYEEWTSLIRPAIERRQRGETEPPALLELRKQKMDAMRRQISEFVATEEELRNERSQRAQQTTRTVIASSLLLSLGIGSLLAYFIWHLVLSISRSYKTALERAYRETAVAQRSAQRLAALHQIDRSILAAKSDPDLVRDALAGLRQLVKSEQALVALFDLENQQAKILAGSAERELYPPENTLLPLADCAPPELLEQPQVRYTDDLRAVEGCPPSYAQLCERGIGSCLTIPLIVQEELIGELSLAATTPDAFDPASRAVVQEVAAQLAIALEQSRLRGQLQAYAAELEQRVEERTTQLQEVNQELEAFAYSVSHDLRAPLRAMESFAQALVEDYGDQINSEGRDYITAIIEASMRMEALISDLLAYSHVTRQEVSLQPTSLAAVVQDALRQLESPIKEHQAEIVISSALPEVMAQHSALLQVVANLVSNAIKFVPAETVPRIEIYAEVIEQEPHNRVKLWVADNGIGIAPEYHQRIFGVFERLHGHKSYTGNGIGLAIVRAAIERMGGEVGVESEPAHGSRFWIALPKANSSLP